MSLFWATPALTIFIPRVDQVQLTLRQPYTGRHKVLCRINKAITIDINGRKTVSLDRVKLAYIIPETVLSPPENLESN
ncbi:transposon Ty3-G Gag-Pol polyprotein [Nephila pilipes]|uniref:Transposon Ty3-G Gag-Pol polyprotein n=1 Tax=Nephila pilipes TaxID=299642 RepID=A0A8X6MTV3_NEPPI|nr:transposon Ty3-G Gag-Pol polyprotein [Nephila pilipes]